MNALDLTRSGLVRALAPAARRAADAAARERAEAIAARIAAAGVAARVVRRGDGDYAVEASGPGLSAREYESVDGVAEPMVAMVVEGAGAG